MKDDGDKKLSPGRAPSEETEDGTIQQRVGKEGEDAAVAYLISHKYRILKRNYRARRGEIDIICEAAGDESGSPVLIFVEVKARSSLHYGDPFEALSEEKMNRIQRAAEVFIMENHLEDAMCRFDVIGVMVGDGNPGIEHVKDVMDY